MCWSPDGRGTREAGVSGQSPEGVAALDTVSGGVRCLRRLVRACREPTS